MEDIIADLLDDGVLNLAQDQTLKTQNSLDQGISFIDFPNYRIH